MNIWSVINVRLISKPMMLVFNNFGNVCSWPWQKNVECIVYVAGRLRLKCDVTCAETRFRLSAKRTSLFKSTGVSSVDYWQASCAHQPAGFVLLVRAGVLLLCDAYWLPTPFSCFPFTSPPVRHHVPSHFKRSLRCTLIINCYSRFYHPSYKEVQ
jgi:hypothetical protein